MSESESKTFALKFISGKYQGGEFPLLAEREVIIGRGPDLDMVLLEDMVSRRHARILTTGGVALIEDLGSTNGSFVNGEKVKARRLLEGDRILIGTNILKVIARDPGATDADALDAKNKLMEASGRRAEAAMTGDIADVPLPDLLQLLQTSRRTGVLTIEGAHRGRVRMVEGQVTHAVIEGRDALGPRKAFFRILGWEEGRFSLSPASDLQDDSGGTFEESTEALIMEAMRQLDELRRLEAEMPPRDAQLCLEHPIAAPLRELEPAALDLIQAAHNGATVQALLDADAGSDLEAAQALATLLQGGFLRVAD